MTLNEKRNRCYGPGGGTRHLHHFKSAERVKACRFEKSNIQGGETGSTCIIKVFSCVRHCSAVIGLL